MKTLKQVEVEPEFVERYLPGKAAMAFGKLYISEALECCNHLCLCGCGNECFLPLTPEGWTLIKSTSGKVSLTPSILQRFECQSHYIITHNKANFV